MEERTDESISKMMFHPIAIALKWRYLGSNHIGFLSSGRKDFFQ